MELHWRESFEEIELIFKKEKQWEEGSLSSLLLNGESTVKEDDTFDGCHKSHVLISELYVKVEHKNDSIGIDLYDKVSTEKEDVKVRQNEKCLVLNLKKKDKKLWGYLYFFSSFVNYKNNMYPNMIKCTKEEKSKIITQEKKFRHLIIYRRMKSLELLNKNIKRDQTAKEGFTKKMEDYAQKIQLQLEETKNAELKAHKEMAKKMAIELVYAEGEAGEADKTGDADKQRDKHGDTQALVGRTDMPKNKAILGDGTDQNKVIELKFTQLKSNELPARESRNIKKTRPGYTSTKNFFLIILIEKAKKLFFKNSDFASCLETLKSVISYISSGSELIREEHIKVLSNLSLLYLLINNIDRCIQHCDECLHLISEEIKNYNTEEAQPEKCNTIDSSIFSTLNSLEDIKCRNYIQYMYIIYAIVTVRKVYAMIKKGDSIENVEKSIICIEEAQNFLPLCFYENINVAVHRLRSFLDLQSLLVNRGSVGPNEMKVNLRRLDELSAAKPHLDLSHNFYISAKRSFYLKNLCLDYANMVNLLLCIYNLVDKQNQMYGFLNKAKQGNSTQFLINIYELILLLRNNSTFMEKIVEIENLKNNHDNAHIRHEIITVLGYHMGANSGNELQFIAINNACLHKIISFLRDGQNGKEHKEEKKGEDVNGTLCTVPHDGFSAKPLDVHTASPACAPNLLENIPYKLKKKNRIAKDITLSDVSPNMLKIELFSNKESYRTIEEKCELLKVELSVKIIKTICYSLNLMQKMIKDNRKEKNILREIVYTLLINLSYSISNLNNSLLKTEKIVSLIYLYFCFSFIYNFTHNEFIIDIYFKKKEEHQKIKMLTLKNDKNWYRISKDTIKDILEKTFVHNFFADYKKYTDWKKKRMGSDDENPENCEQDIMLRTVSFLIKKVKREMNGRSGDRSGSENGIGVSCRRGLPKREEPQIVLLRNKHAQEVYRLLTILNKDGHYLKSIHYSLLLLSCKYNGITTSHIHVEYIHIVKKMFTRSFFAKKEVNMREYTNEPTGEYLSMMCRHLLQKHLSYFKDSYFFTFKNTKRSQFLKKCNTENAENCLVAYIQAVINKYKKVKVLRNINYCLRCIHADQTIIANATNTMMKFLENVSMDFHILNIVLRFSHHNLYSHPLLQISDLHSVRALEHSVKTLSNSVGYKKVVHRYFTKFVKCEAVMLSGKYSPYGL
ncbi:conserved Plasmodium protein, unknown function [Plasmodium ovale]|uniref:Uncharacterized protein n=1 Tax=Plasmodium ovale TaxID=36330 RepID=A0A1D3TLP3_PLAOA|nr:conserved Plasmodium protein, unknown function [Plasmodium ovale]